MATAFELAKWLDGLELSEEEKKVLEPIFKQEKRVKKLEEGQLLRSDYSRNLDKLRETEKELQAKIDEKMQALDQHELELTKWRNEDVIPKVKLLEDKVYKDGLEIWKYKQAMDRIKEQYGADPKDFGLDPAAPPPAAGTPQAPVNPADKPNYLGRQDFDAFLQDYQKTPYLVAEFQDLSVEHQELFGKPLKGMAKLLQEAQAAKMPLRDYWAKSNKVDERRAELAKKAQQDHDEAIRAEERTKVLSEHQLPSVRPANPVSALSQLPKPSEVTAQRGNQKQQSINEIVSAFNTGKYAEMAKRSRGQ